MENKKFDFTDINKAKAARILGSYKEIDKALSTFQKGKTMKVGVKEMIDEHKNLVKVLESPSHKDDLKEAKKQKEELEEYEEKLGKAYDILGLGDVIEKGGEGSKGGKVIGHTKSGKPIYENKKAHEYNNFSPKEHEEAALKFSKLYDNEHNDVDKLKKYADSTVDHWQQHYKKGGNYKTPESEKEFNKSENKHDFSVKERENLSEKHEAMPDGSFPIRNEQDLKDAIKSIGRAKDYNKAKAWIKKRAKELGKESALPDDWTEKAMTTGSTPGYETAKTTKELEKAEDGQTDGIFAKAENDEQKAKMKKVMDEWKAGKLKSSSGEKVTDQKQALAIAMNEAGLSKADDIEDTEEYSKEPKDETKKPEKEVKLVKAFEVLGINLTK